jgi:HK97 family phage portal protein
LPSWRDFFGAAASPAPVVEERNAPMNFGREDLIPLPGSNYATWTGMYLRDDQAAGLPAVGGAIRLISESIGSLPCLVYNGTGPDRQKANGTPQWDLLHERPSMDSTPFDLFSDIAACIETRGNAFLQKVRDARGRVVELIVIDPDAVRVYRSAETREKTFDIQAGEDRYTGLTSTDILHVRGMTLRGGIRGISPIELHRNSISMSYAVQEYIGRYFQNDASPGLVIKVPGSLSNQQARQILEVFAANHSGLGNAHKPGILAGGADLDQVKVNLSDTTAIDAQKFAVREVARMFSIPAALLGADEGTSRAPEDEAASFLKFGLGPRLRRIESALRADPDLFGGTDLYPEFKVDSLLRADTAERFTAYVRARQAGWLSANEIRELENYPAVPDGDNVQQTPVGGAPNPTPSL